MRPPIGLIPAAGLASRLAQFPYPKELLPIVYAGEGGRRIPRPVLTASLDQMRLAGVTQCLIIVAEWKLEILRVLGDGASAGVSLAYVVRSTPRGLSDALDTATPWLADRDVCVTLPDTLVEPGDALARICEERVRSGAELVLGVFPTDKPEQLGPVRMRDDGQVVEVLDKPVSTDVRNTWGMATWSPRFTALLHETCAAVPPGEQGPVLGAVFQRAVAEGMPVRAVLFADGRFSDLGTPEGLGAAIADGALIRS